MMDDIQIENCISDNGIYTSRAFMEELLKKKQGIKCSCVGGHHHNSMAENSIKIVFLGEPGEIKN